jgi:hypothetical protein
MVNVAMAKIAAEALHPHAGDPPLDHLGQTGLKPAVPLPSSDEHFGFLASGRPGEAIAIPNAWRIRNLA